MPTGAPIGPNWLEQRGTKFGTGSPMSRPTFWDQLRSDGYPQIWSGGPKNGCRTIFQLSLAKIGGTPHSQLVQKGQLGRPITCSNIVPCCSICFEPLGALQSVWPFGPWTKFGGTHLTQIGPKMSAWTWVNLFQLCSRLFQTFRITGGSHSRFG